eukprot:5688879-Prymnesium_polylepis.2
MPLPPEPATPAAGGGGLFGGFWGGGGGDAHAAVPQGPSVLERADLRSAEVEYVLSPTEAQ